MYQAGEARTEMPDTELVLMKLDAPIAVGLPDGSPHTVEIENWYVQKWIGA
jgi:hypothetical protein